MAETVEAEYSLQGGKKKRKKKRGVVGERGVVVVVVKPEWQLKHFLNV